MVRATGRGRPPSDRPNHACRILRSRINEATRGLVDLFEEEGEEPDDALETGR